MFSTFTAIFEALAAIEDDLAAEATELQRKQIIDTLLSLRRTMDKCIQYWLKFEERINEIQDRYDINLPDTLPPGFMEEIYPGERETSVVNNDADDFVDLPAGAEVEDQSDKLYHLSNEIAVNSFRRGLGFWELAMLKEAVEEFNKVVEKEPNLTIGHLCLGLSSAQLGKVEEAFKELKLVLALDQNVKVKALALNTLGIILTEKEKYRQALDFFEKATETDPELMEGWFNLAATSYNMQEYERAEEAFVKVKELVPDDWEVELHLGRTRSNLGLYESAAEALTRACFLNPREPLITFELAMIYRLLGKKMQAHYFFYTTLKLLESKR